MGNKSAIRNSAKRDLIPTPGPLEQQIEGARIAKARSEEGAKRKRKIAQKTDEYKKRDVDPKLAHRDAAHVLISFFHVKRKELESSTAPLATTNKAEIENLSRNLNDTEEVPSSKDTMEVSIVMSDISEQPSVTSGDSSAVDLNSDPRPAQQQTPTRAAVQHTPTRTTGVKVTKRTLGHTAVPTDDRTHSNGLFFPRWLILATITATDVLATRMSMSSNHVQDVINCSRSSSDCPRFE